MALHLWLQLYFSYTINTLWSFFSPLYGRNLFRFIWVSTFGGLLSTNVSFVAQCYCLHYLYGIIGYFSCPASYNF